ncbi:hypothetical protein FPQ18DRAFT_301078 [Pyronema domesticum]|nr:hypothetical protein FPQ18DRAFT_301078 [Pyronema domesticum]
MPCTMGYPMQKDCMVKCHLPLDGLLSWTDLSHFQQEAAIDRLLLLENIPTTSREFVTDHLQRQVGKFKNEKKRQWKRAAVKAAKANLYRANQLLSSRSTQRTSKFVTQGAQTLDKATTGQVYLSQTFPAQDVQSTVAPVVPDGSITITSLGISASNPQAAVSGQAQGPFIVFAGFRNQASATYPVAVANFTPATAADALRTSTPSPHRQGSPLESKNHPKVSATPGLIIPASRPYPTTAPTRATPSPAQTATWTAINTPNIPCLAQSAHTIQLPRGSLRFLGEAPRLIFSGRCFSIWDLADEPVAAQPAVATNELGERNVGISTIFGMDMSIDAAEDEVEEGEIVKTYRRGLKRCTEDDEEESRD